MREQRVQKAINEARESLIMTPRLLNQITKHRLMAAGLTAGQIDRMEKGLTATDPMLLKLERFDGKSIGDLAKAFGGYASLVKTMFNKGYSREEIKNMLHLDESELVDLLRV